MRLYRQGDDAAQVDWKRSARGDRLYSRERADTSHTQAVLVVDASRSMGVGHGTGEPSKFGCGPRDRGRAGHAAGRAGRYRRALCADGARRPGWAPAWRHPSRPRRRRRAGAARPRPTPCGRRGRRGGGRAAAPALVAGRAFGRLGWSRLRRCAAPRGRSRPRRGGADATAPGDRRSGRPGVVELEDAETGEVRIVDAAALTAAYVAGGSRALPHARSGPARAAIDWVRARRRRAAGAATAPFPHYPQRPRGGP